MANENALTAFRFFRGRGYSDAQAAGIVGNLLGESGLNTRAVGDGGLAKGIAQHHPDRWGTYVGRLASGADPYDLVNQLDFVDWELRNKETRAYKALMSAQDVDQATAAFIGYERPQGFTWENPRAGHNYSGRLSFANQVLAGAGGTEAVEVPTPLNPPVQPGTPLSEFVHSQAPSATGQSPTSYTVGGQGAVAINDVWAAQPVTHTQQLELERQQEEADGVSLIEGMGIAISQEQMLPWLFKSRPEFIPVAGHQTDWNEVTKDLPEIYWDRFVDSSSPAQDAYIRKSILDDLEADQKLASLGGMGVALRIGAGLTDPAAWAAGAGITMVSGGAGLPAFLAAKFGRAGMVGYGAAVGAASALPTEGVLLANKPTYDWSSAAMSVGAGMLLGGTFGALGRNPHVAEQARMIEKTGESIILDEMRRQTLGGSSVGAMQAGVREDLRSDTWAIVRDGADLVQKPFAQWARFDLSAMLKGSDNTFTRILGANMVEDGARSASGVTEIGASEVATRLHRLAEVRWRKSYDTNFKAYAKRLGVKWGQAGELRGEYSRKIAEYVRSRNPMEDFDPEVAAAGNEFRSMMQRWRELASNPGVLDGTKRRSVRGFENAKDNAHYVPRIFDLGSVQDKLMKYGHDRLATLIAKGMQEVNEDISDELAMKFGKGYIKRLHSLSAGELQRNAAALSGDDMEALKGLLRDSTDVSDEELDDILLGLKPGPKDGAVTRAKTRLFYDEGFAQQIERIDGTAVDMVRISDLFNNDADALMASYSRQMAGRVAMARLRVRNPKWREGDEFDEFLIDGVTNDSEWTTTLEKVRSVGDTIGAQTGDQAYSAKLTRHTQEDIKRLQFAYDNIIGRPHWDESSDFAQAQRLLRDTNFLRVMGQVGFAQIPEFANAAWQVGLKAMFSNMPSLRSMWRNAKTGKIDDTLAQEWEDITGLGTDWLRHSDGRRMDDFDNPLAGIENNRVLAKVDDLQQKGKRAMTALSGMAPINTVLQRLTGRAIFNKFALLAKRGGEITADRRMQALGLDTDMLKRVVGQINSHATFDGKRLKAMNFARWADQEALANFENAVFRLGRTVIQENDIGNMAMWMSRPTARTLLQFRSFMLAGWSKQFLNGLNMRDFTTFATFTSTAFLASMTYIMREQLNAIGRPDARERLGERLTLEKIAAAGLQNSSWFTILAPAVDSFASRFGATVFDGRTTQQPSDAILGNPTVNFADALLAVPTAAVHASQGNFLRSDAQTLRAVLPFQNLMGITQLFNVLAGPLPQ